MLLSSGSGVANPLSQPPTDFHSPNGIPLLRELLGPESPQQDVVWCEMSIVGQCFVGAPRPGGHGPRALFKLDASRGDDPPDHMMAFSLAGAAAIRKGRPAAKPKRPARTHAKRGKTR